MNVGFVAGAFEEGCAAKEPPVGAAAPELGVEAPSVGLAPNKPPDGGGIGLADDGVDEVSAGLAPNRPPEGVGFDEASTGFAPNRPPEGAGAEEVSAGLAPNIAPDGGAVDALSVGFAPNRPPEGGAVDEASAGLAPKRPPEGGALGAAEAKNEGAAGFEAAAPPNMLVAPEAGGGPEGVVEKDSGDGLAAAGVVAPLGAAEFMAPKKPPEAGAAAAVPKGLGVAVAAGVVGPEGGAKPAGLAPPKLNPDVADEVVLVVVLFPAPPNRPPPPPGAAPPKLKPPPDGAAAAAPPPNSEVAGLLSPAGDGAGFAPKRLVPVEGGGAVPVLDPKRLDEGVLEVGAAVPKSEGAAAPVEAGLPKENAMVDEGR